MAKLRSNKGAEQTKTTPANSLEVAETMSNNRQPDTETQSKGRGRPKRHKAEEKVEAKENSISDKQETLEVPAPATKNENPKELEELEEPKPQRKVRGRPNKNKREENEPEEAAKIAKNNELEVAKSPADIEEAEQVKEPKEVRETKELKTVAVKKVRGGRQPKQTKEKIVESGKTNSKEAEEKVAESEKMNVEDETTVSSEEIDFKKMNLVKVINESNVSKSITFEGKYDGQTAVVKLDKTIFDEKVIKEALISDGTIVERDFLNDIYSNYTISKIKDHLKCIVVYPANESVMIKYTHSDCILFSETPDHYLKVVEPYIAKRIATEPDYNQWVYNILDGKSEVDRVILNDPDIHSGFMLVHDLKWSGDPKELNMLAICRRRDIRSLRDLNDSHLILLKNILTKGTKTIKDNYKEIFKNNNKAQLRSYIHYQPSFYHFHVHFKLVDPSDYISSDRDNLLSTVINNINLLGDYYKRSTLTYPLSMANRLYKELKDAKRV